MAIYALGDLVPVISPTAFVHPDAVIIGNVIIEDECSIWPTAVLRGDASTVHIGARTSIQDGTIVHCSPRFVTTIAPDCTVGHNAYLEGCTIETHCLIGSSCLVLNGATVRSGSIVAAGAVVRENMVVNAGTIVAGVPATERGPVDESFPERIERSVKHYVENAARFKRDLRRID